MACLKGLVTPGSLFAADGGEGEKSFGPKALGMAEMKDEVGDDEGARRRCSMTISPNSGAPSMASTATSPLHSCGSGMSEPVENSRLVEKLLGREVGNRRKSLPAFLRQKCRAAGGVSTSQPGSPNAADGGHVLRAKGAVEWMINWPEARRMTVTLRCRSTPSIFIG